MAYPGSCVCLTRPHLLRNSWDRVPYITTLRTGSPSIVPKVRDVHRNFFIGNYNSQVTPTAPRMARALRATLCVCACALKDLGESEPDAYVSYRRPWTLTTAPHTYAPIIM